MRLGQGARDLLPCRSEPDCGRTALMNTPERMKQNDIRVANIFQIPLGKLVRHWIDLDGDDKTFRSNDLPRNGGAEARTDPGRTGPVSRWER